MEEKFEGVEKIVLTNDMGDKVELVVIDRIVIEEKTYMVTQTSEDFESESEEYAILEMFANEDGEHAEFVSDDDVITEVLDVFENGINEDDEDSCEFNEDDEDCKNCDEYAECCDCFNEDDEDDDTCDECGEALDDCECDVSDEE